MSQSDLLSEAMFAEFGIDPRVVAVCREAEGELGARFAEIDAIAERNQYKVLHAMQKNKLSDMHFAATTGYGYNDLGRDTLEQIYADVFHTEAALVRPQMISGTHALTTALFGNLRHGDELLSAVGAPYDTLQGVIGIRPTKGSLSEHGVVYKQADLREDGTPNWEEIARLITPKTRLVTIQRSKGYAWRHSFTAAEIGEIVRFVKDVRKDIIVMVDNCYGEFVEDIEPSDAGADMVVGSLIKNPGGGLAPVGGYIAGTEECVENASFRLSPPGMGREVGPTLGITPMLTQGLFLAPTVVSGAVKGAVLAAAVFERMGFDVLPRADEARADIVQAIRLNAAENVIAFCRGVQRAAPVDSFVAPEPWDMPGYDNQVIMAAGAFVQGSSIELSADAPIVPPYIVYMQGGLTWFHAKMGVMMALNEMAGQGLVRL